MTSHTSKFRTLFLLGRFSALWTNVRKSPISSQSDLISACCAVLEVCHQDRLPFRYQTPRAKMRVRSSKSIDKTTSSSPILLIVTAPGFLQSSHPFSSTSSTRIVNSPGSRNRKPLQQEYRTIHRPDTTYNS